MSHHQKFLRLCLLRSWSLVNSFCILVVDRGRSEGVALSFDINWWTLKLIVTLLGLRTAEIRKMNFWRWILWEEMCLQSHDCWMLRVPCHAHRRRWGPLAAVKNWLGWRLPEMGMPHMSSNSASQPYVGDTHEDPACRILLSKDEYLLRIEKLFRWKS